MEQFPRIHAKRIRNLMDIYQADVSFSALYSSDVRPVEITGKRQRLLRKTPLLPQFTYPLTKSLLNLCFLPTTHHGNGIIADDNKSTDFTYQERLIHLFLTLLRSLNNKAWLEKAISRLVARYFKGWHGGDGAVRCVLLTIQPPIPPFTAPSLG
jgi:hypothetical protein